MAEPTVRMRVNWANVRHYRYAENDQGVNFAIRWADGSQDIWVGEEARVQHNTLLEAIAVVENYRDRAVLQLPSVTLNLNYVAMVRWEHEDIEDTLRAIVVLVCQDPEEDGGVPTVVRLVGSEALLLRDLLGRMSA